MRRRRDKTDRSSPRPEERKPVFDPERAEEIERRKEALEKTRRQRRRR